MIVFVFLFSLARCYIAMHIFVKYFKTAVSNGKTVAFCCMCTLLLFLTNDNLVTQFKETVSAPFNKNKFSQAGVGLKCNQMYQQPHLMRITDASGRLGNNIFRLVALLAIARKYCYQPVFRKKTFTLLQETFNLTMFGEDPEGKDHNQWRQFYEVSCCRYSNRVEQLNTTFNWTLGGFLQSWRYTAGEEEYVRSTLKFHDEVLKQANGFFHDLLNIHNILEGVLFVGIHIRRGDFVNNPNGYLTAPPEYFNRSMGFFREKFSKHRVIFIVASNDLEWARNNTRGDDVYYTEKSASVDFAILAMCNHTIITSGSYGYMAAWLSGGFVIYFSGFPKPLSWLDRLFISSDYYPPHWFPM